MENKLATNFGSCWKEYPDCTGYYASEDGRVYSAKSDCLMSPSRNNQVSLFYDGEAHSTKVANIIYTTFVGPIPTGMTTGYKDGNCENNSLENIIIVPRSYKGGTLPPEVIEKRKDSFANKYGMIVGYGPDGEVVEARTIREMTEKLDGRLGRTSVSDCIHGKRSSAKGWTFTRVVNNDCAW